MLRRMLLLVSNLIQGWDAGLGFSDSRAFLELSLSGQAPMSKEKMICLLERRIVSVLSTTKGIGIQALAFRKWVLFQW